MSTAQAKRTTTTREIEGRDSVGLYLDEIARTPLLDAETEVELSKTIEAGLLAQHLLDTGRVGRRKGGAPMRANEAELEWLAEQGQLAVDRFIVMKCRPGAPSASMRSASSVAICTPTCRVAAGSSDTASSRDTTCSGSGVPMSWDILATCLKLVTGIRPGVIGSSGRRRATASRSRR